MSTYYYFKCSNCKQTGGFFSRQMWGIGNFDIIDSFKFFAHHAVRCGTEYIGIYSEHEDKYYDWESMTDSGNRKKFLKETKDVFPLSNDWKFMEEKHKDFKKEWVKRELKDD